MFGRRRKETAREQPTDRSASLRPGTSPSTAQLRPRSAVLSGQAEELMRNRQYAAAIPILQDIVDSLRLSAQPGRPGRNERLGFYLSKLAGCLHETGSMREALAAAEEAAAILTPLLPQVRSSLYECLECSALALHALSERPEERAAAAMRAAALLAQESRPEFMEQALTRRERMLNLAALALKNTSDLREALRVYKEAIEVTESIAETLPDVRHRLAIHFASMATLHAKVGEYVEACAALESCETSMSDPEFALPPDNRLAIAAQLLALGAWMVANRHHDDAGRPLLLAIQIYRAVRSDTQKLIEPALASDIRAGCVL